MPFCFVGVRVVCCRQQRKNVDIVLFAGDALGSIGAILSGLIVMFASGEWRFYADPTLSVLLALIILRSSLPVVQHSAMILMQAVPPSVDIEQLSAKLLAVDGVDYIGSLHAVRRRIYFYCFCSSVCLSVCSLLSHFFCTSMVSHIIVFKVDFECKRTRGQFAHRLHRH